MILEVPCLANRPLLTLCSCGYGSKIPGTLKKNGLVSSEKSTIAPVENPMGGWHLILSKLRSRNLLHTQSKPSKGLPNSLGKSHQLKKVQTSTGLAFSLASGLLRLAALFTSKARAESNGFFAKDVCFYPNGSKYYSKKKTLFEVYSWSFTIRYHIIYTLYTFLKKKKNTENTPEKKKKKCSSVFLFVSSEPPFAVSEVAFRKSSLQGWAGELVGKMIFWRYFFFLKGFTGFYWFFNRVL